MWHFVFCWRGVVHSSMVGGVVAALVDRGGVAMVPWRCHVVPLALCYYGRHLRGWCGRGPIVIAVDNTVIA